MKIRSDGHLAAEIFEYVDDGRATGHCKDLTWRAARAYGSGCLRRGIQDASRKQTSPTESPGPWAGTVTCTEGGSLVGMVSQEKWDKTKGLLKELTEMLTKGPLPLQRMLEIRGFLMYVVRTYPWLNPYMKGMHLTINSWRAGRAEDGFKMTAKELQVFENSKWANVGFPCRRADEEGDGGTPTTRAPEEECAPATVEPVLRYLRDLECLAQLTDTGEPPCQLYRDRRQSAFFVVGDASGKGKGNAIIEQYGAVSEEVAKAMAQGALNHSAAKTSIAITGIAGPGGSTENKPVGMVCFAWAVQFPGSPALLIASTQIFDGDRQAIREQACAYALNELIQILRK